VARGKEDLLVTKNLVPGESVYGEKRISVEVSCLIVFSFGFFGGMEFFFINSICLLYLTTLFF